ncbi:MAG: hypothetical protein PV340_01855 [Wolbachia sp.]|nr:hypothetical protein [Wolbachia sp.]MDD9336152.1 hypothetical protein [Wolbachia sp.]
MSLLVVGDKPDASHKNGPLSGVSEVKVDDVGRRVKGLINKFKQSGCGC